MPTWPRLIQLHLQAGVPTPEGPYIGALQASPRSPRPAFSAVLAEPLAGADQGLCRRAVDIALRQLSAPSGSVTRSLERAAHDIHEQAQRQFSDAPGTLSGGVGLACAVLQDQRAHLALAGPTLALIIGPDGAEVLSGSGLSTPGRRGLGVGRAPSLRLYRRELDPGAVLLLAFSSLRDAIDAELLIEAAAGGPEQLLALVYRRMTQSRDRDFAAAVLVPAAPDAPAAPPLRAGSGTPEREDRAPGRATALPPASPVAASASDIASGPDDPQQPSALPPAAATPAFWPPPAVALPPLPERLELELRSPRRIPSSRDRPLTVSPLTLTIVATLLVAAALGLALWYLQAQAATSREARHDALQREAAALYQAALGAPSRDTMRQKLFQARDVADAATAMLRDAPETAALLASVQDRLTQLNAVAPMADPRVLVNLRLTATTSSSLQDPLLQGSDLLALDPGLERLYRLPAGEPAWRPESPPALTPVRGATPRNLRRLVWMPKGGLWSQDALLAFDESRGLWEYRSVTTLQGASAAAGGAPSVSEGEWRRVPLRGAGQWETFAGAQGFNGSLYVLDPAANQVWRYIPTDAGFDSERTGALTSGSDLRDAVDFAVDGDIYVLLRSGRVIKFSGGRPQDFPLDGLDRRLSGPSALFTSPEAHWVYVADAGNQRIVAFDKTGVFQRQIPLPGSLPPVTDLLADEGHGLLYLVCGRELVAAALPSASP